MSGILDQKSRVIDTIITEEGKRQLINGGMKIRFASFSDAGMIYRNSGGIFEKPDITLGLESFSTRNDYIFPYTDESGKVPKFITSEYSITGSESLLFSRELTETPSQISNIIRAFKNQQLISNKEIVRPENRLGIYPESSTFYIRDERPFKGEPEITRLEDADSLFADKRLSRVPNFKYLPPVQVTNTNATSKLGEYVNLSEKNDLDPDSLKSNLDNLDYQEFTFSKYTDSNDLVVQMFEQASGAEFQKLDIIKYGRVHFKDEKKPHDVYFIGKVYMDSFDFSTFINIFTVLIQ